MRIGSGGGQDAKSCAAFRSLLDSSGAQPIRLLAVRLIDSASNLFHRAMLMTVYSTGMRRAEMCQIKLEDIDSDRMLIHIRQGKGRRDRDVPLSPNLLETLREYWRWMKPKRPYLAGHRC